MNSSEDYERPTASTTEIALVTGARYRIAADPKDVEQAILDAARGSIMRFAWLVEAETGDEVAINPEYVLTLRVVDS